MSGRLLDFSNYVGGSDNVQIVELFTDNQQTYIYNFDTDITNYTFTLDQQTLILSDVAYDRQTGLPTFSNTSIAGYFANTTPSAGTYVTNRDDANGTVNITVPTARYTGQMMPNARANVPVTVFSVNWEDAGLTNPNKNSHRWAILERYRSGTNPVGDPTLDANFITPGIGAVATFTDNAGTDALRVEGTYSVTGLTTGNGQLATFSVQVNSSGLAEVDITARGNTYRTSETITLLDENMGGGGAADITVTVSTVS
tara:strand:- start:4427 stop:5194 length:768 start_codon:yes stop_codon:yes gene_type:complete